MFEQIKQSVRRARQSSSDSEPSTPLKVQRTMAANESSPTPGQKTIDDIYCMLEQMNKSNKETRSSMEKRLDKFEVDMKRHIDSSVEGYRGLTGHTPMLQCRRCRFSLGPYRTGTNYLPQLQTLRRLRPSMPVKHV